MMYVRFGNIVRVLVWIHCQLAMSTGEAETPTTPLTVVNVKLLDSNKTQAPYTAINPVSYRVATVISPPFMSVYPLWSGTSGNDRYFGFIKDILDKASQLGGFKYTLYNVEGDSVIGDGIRPDNKTIWQDLLNELKQNKCDIAAADLAVTSDRLADADFAWPYFSGGVTAIYAKVSPHYGDYKTNPLLLFAPFSLGVWLMCLLSLAATIACLYIVGRVNPNEWRKASEHGIVHPQEAANFDRSNTVFFLLSSMLWQGYTIPPRSAAGRTVAIFWWLFILFIVMSYMAALVVQFMERSREMYSPRSYPDFNAVVMDERLQLIVVKNSSAAKFLERDTNPPFPTIRSRVSKNNNFVATFMEGLAKVRDDTKHVLITDTSLADWAVKQTPCDLEQLKKPLHNYLRAFAVRKKSDALDVLNDALLRTIESGERESYYAKWFKMYCTEKDDTSILSVFFQRLLPYSKQPIGLADVEIAFIFLFVGLFIGSVICAVEAALYKKNKMAVRRLQREEEWARGGDQELQITAGNSLTEPDTPH